MGAASDETARAAAHDPERSKTFQPHGVELPPETFTPECSSNSSDSCLANLANEIREAQNQNGHSDVRTRWSSESQHHHHSRAHLYPAVEIDHILIGHSDATRGNRTSDIFRLIGA